MTFGQALFRDLSYQYILVFCLFSVNSEGNVEWDYFRLRPTGNAVFFHNTYDNIFPAGCGILHKGKCSN